MSEDPARDEGRTRPISAGSPRHRLEHELAERAMDVFVYAPAGALLSVLDDFPTLAAKGRTRLLREVRNAQIVGRIAVTQGQRVVKRRLDHLVDDWARGSRAPAGTPPPTPPRGAARPPEATEAAEAPTAGAPKPPPGAEASADHPVGGLEVDRAIPDYDTLSASQVVRRLDGLTPEELRAVIRHESAHRGRRTILNRAHQLGEVGWPRPAVSPDMPDIPSEPDPPSAPPAADS